MFTAQTSNYSWAFCALPINEYNIMNGPILQSLCTEALALGEILKENKKRNHKNYKGGIIILSKVTIQRPHFIYDAGLIF